MLRMAPPPAFSMNGIAACEARTVAITSMSRPLAQPASSSLAPKPEALLTRMSMPPSESAAAAM